MFEDFYARPMVQRIAEIFGNPRPPAQITQDQFEGAQGEIERIATMPWHELTGDFYQLEMCYVELQQEVFDYLFPALLIRWWESQLTRVAEPEGECGLYRAIDFGRVLAKMMSSSRQERVLSWMVEAYMQGVDNWGGCLSLPLAAAKKRKRHKKPEPDNLYFPLMCFNALGMSVSITGAILDKLENVSTLGRAQWWLVYATGVLWDEDEYPDPDIALTGGRGEILWGAGWIFDHGYLEGNLREFRTRMTYPKLLEMMRQSLPLLSGTPHEDWAKLALSKLEEDPSRMLRRIERLYHRLSLPALGGTCFNPLADPKEAEE